MTTAGGVGGGDTGGAAGGVADGGSTACGGEGGVAAGGGGFAFVVRSGLDFPVGAASGSGSACRFPAGSGSG